MLVIAAALVLGLIFFDDYGQNPSDTQSADGSAATSANVDALDETSGAADITDDVSGGEAPDAIDIGTEELEQVAPPDPETALDVGETDTVEAQVESVVTPPETGAADGDAGVALDQDGEPSDDNSAVDEVEADAVSEPDLVLPEAELIQSTETETMNAATIVPTEPDPIPPTTADADVAETTSAAELAEADSATGSTADTGATSDQTADSEIAEAPLPVRVATSHDGIRVQLASYGSEKRAQDGWLELKAAVSDIIGEQEAMIEEAALDSGTFYRLQVGYFNSTVEARDYCNEVFNRQLDCIVIPD